MRSSTVLSGITYSQLNIYQQLSLVKMAGHKGDRVGSKISNDHFSIFSPEELYEPLPDEGEMDGKTKNLFYSTVIKMDIIY